MRFVACCVALVLTGVVPATSAEPSIGKSVQPAGFPKVRVTYDAVDGDDNPKHEGRGYHGSTIGAPSSLNYRGKWGVSYNNQVAVIRAVECEQPADERFWHERRQLNACHS